MVSEDILEKEKKLEDLLRERSDISFGDKLRNLGSNVKKNIKYVIPFGVCLAGAGLVAYLGYRWYEQSQLVSPLISIQQYLGGFKELLESAVEHEMTFVPQEAFLDPVEVAARQVVHNYDVGETREIVKLISDSKEVFQGENLPVILETTESLYEKVRGVVASKDIFMLGTMYGGMIDLTGWILSSFAYYFDAPGWEDNLLDKKELRKKLKSDWPELKAELRENPNVKEIYSFVDALANSGIDVYNFFEILYSLEARKDPKYKPVFELMSGHPKEYCYSWKIDKTFRNYDNEQKLKALEKKLAEEKAKPKFVNPFEVEEQHFTNPFEVELE